MSGTPYVNIAQVVKTRGLEGKVLVRCTEGLPLCIYEGLEVHVVPPLLRGVRCGAVSSLESWDGSSAVIGIEGLDGIDAAEQLVGRYLLAHGGDLDLRPEEDMVLVLGCSAVSDDGRELGTVTEYLETKANDVLVITRPGGGELLVPVIDETVVAVPSAPGEPLVLHLLQGLEEL
ncbi:MAG: ribosome maturation factor RimM [Coriobacteriales bacterium]